MERLGAASFLNAMRLHRDSITLFKNKSYPTAYQLSIIAQEEIGKTFLFEEVVFRFGMAREWDEARTKDFLDTTLRNHQIKQGWFSRHADDIRRYGGQYVMTAFAREIYQKRLEPNKQRATYVGLPVKRKKIDVAGRIQMPDSIKRKQAQAHITRVNDFALDLIEGCRRSFYSVDSDDLDDVLKLKLANELGRIWPNSAPTRRREIARKRKHPVVRQER